MFASSERQTVAVNSTISSYLQLRSSVTAFRSIQLAAASTGGGFQASGCDLCAAERVLNHCSQRKRNTLGSTFTTHPFLILPTNKEKKDALWGVKEHLGVVVVYDL